jgi:hypothetical protein
MERRHHREGRRDAALARLTGKRGSGAYPMRDGHPQYRSVRDLVDNERGCWVEPGDSLGPGAALAGHRFAL